MTTWTATIPLLPLSKGNEHRIGLKAGTAKRRIVNSEKANAFLANARLFLQASVRPEPPIADNEKLAVMVGVRYPNYLHDLDIELVKDALQYAGIVPNDSQFREQHAYADDEVGEPEIRIVIERIGLLPWEPKRGRR